MKDWKDCKNILLVRLDNMGDVIMNNAAFRQLRQQFRDSKITLLTSSMAAPIVPFLGTVDDTLIFDSPWMKLEGSDQPGSLLNLINKIKTQQFDACILFNVYSQNIFAAALLAYLAEIPLRAGYARENPYHLLTHWYPDPEPLFEIKHQIQRDLKLLEIIGLQPDLRCLPILKTMTTLAPLDISDRPTEIPSFQYTLLHLEVSEAKRQYPVSRARQLIHNLLADGESILFTGQHKSAYLDACLTGVKDANLLDLRGHTDIAQLLYLVQHAKGVICVNTSIMHIACAYQRPTLALYANTNFQHTPWNEHCQQVLFEVPDTLQSRNQIIAFAARQPSYPAYTLPSSQELVAMYKDLIQIASNDSSVCTQ